MKTRNLIVVAAGVVLCSACIPSVNPFYTEKEVIFDARLVGEWQAKDKESDPEDWKFEKSGDNAYKVLVTEKNDKHGDLSGHLFKLKDQLFLDLTPSDCKFPDDQAGIVAASMFPGHLLAHVSQIEPTLQLTFFNFDWLQKHLEENPAALAHHAEEKHLLLTATTKELQDFVLKHLSNDELFKTPAEFTRKTQTATAAKPAGVR
jgi:hypothetical protein